MDINKFVQSKTFKWVLAGLAELAVLLFVFWLGTGVGMRKADFTVRWEENYRRNFGGPENIFMMPRPMDKFLPDPAGMLNPHGVSGRVLKNDGSTMVVKGENNTEKTVLVGDNTEIFLRRQEIKAVDVMTGDQVVVIGGPDDQGRVKAKFIRVFNDSAKPDSNGILPQK